MWKKDEYGNKKKYNKRENRREIEQLKQENEYIDHRHNSHKNNETVVI